MQSILPLQDGSALRLTTAKYYTPSHKVIHEKGITPDIVVTMSDEEEHDVFLKRTPGGLDTVEPQDLERVRNARDVLRRRSLRQERLAAVPLERHDAGSAALHARQTEADPGSAQGGRVDVRR